MQSGDQDDLSSVLQSLRDDLDVLQVKVAVLEALFVKDESLRREYSRMVDEELQRLRQERKRFPPDPIIN